MEHSHRLTTRLGGQNAAGVCPDTPIAHLGLDSPAVALANTLGHEFGVASPTALLLDGSTVADLAAVLTGGQPTQRQVDFAAEADRRGHRVCQPGRGQPLRPSSSCESPTPVSEGL